MQFKQEKFLIWQYRGKPKALGTIRAVFNETSSTFKTSLQTIDILNIETATGYALNLIGRHVGISRILSKAIAKEYFGFEEDGSALGFGQGEFYRFGDSLNSSVVLSDDDYRFFIKARILKNYQSGTLDNIVTSVRRLTGNSSNVIDNQDMTMNIVVDSKWMTSIRLYAIKYLDILVRPVGVNYRYLLVTNETPFGWDNDVSSFGFNQGIFVRLVDVNNE